MTILTLCISDLFDTIGVFIGTGKKVGIFKIDENGQIPKNMERAMIADSCGTIIASLFGTSNVTTYLESTAGIESGGRTGLTSVFVAILFLLTLFLSPIITVIPMEAVSPVLIFIGISMISNVLKIDFNNIKEAIPAFFIIVMMPFAYSISIGIEWGFIAYVLVNIFAKKDEKDNISPIIYIFVILFVVKYIYQFLG
jgi:AGZA family xanthine/uracil permease-like MFS transporter